MSKPDWTPEHLKTQIARWNELYARLDNHFDGCRCEVCREWRALAAAVCEFSDDEVMSAMLTQPKLENEFMH